VKNILKKILLFSLLLVFLSGENMNLAHNTSLSSTPEVTSNPDSLLLQQFDRALQFLRKGEFQYAEQSFRNATNTIENGIVNNKTLVFRTYVNFGVLLGRIGKSQEALKYYNLSEQFTIDNFGVDSQKLVPIYVNMGNIFAEAEDLFKAQTYYEKALNLTGNKGNRFLPKIHNNLGTIYYKKGQYDLALEAFSKSLNLKEKAQSNDKPSTLNGIANCYRTKGNFVKAEFYYVKCIEEAKRIGGDNYYQLGDYYLNYAVFQNDRKNNDQVLHYLTLAKKVYESNYGFKHPDTAHCLFNFGDWYHDTEKKYDLALEYYQKAIVAELDNFQDSSIYINPNLNEIEPQISILKILKGKARALKSLYSTSDKISDLEFGLQTYDLCLNIIDKIRIGYQDEESKFYLSKNEKDTYTVAIEIAVELFQLTGDVNYKEKAFKYAERSKAASLMSSLNDVNAKNFGGIPQELQDEEILLRKDIASYREKIYEERKKASPDRKKISDWQGVLFDLNEKYNQMVLRFEEDYPEYYALKYDNHTIDIEELQSRLEDNDVLIEYSISDSALFTFTITSNSFEVARQSLDKERFESHLEEVRNCLKTNDFAERSAEYYKRYTKSAYYLYKELFQNQPNNLDNKNLMIVPDGKMAYIPFGVLLKKEADSTRMNYRGLDYLIRTNTITYHNSATLGFSIESAGFSFSSNKSVLAFAPSYEDVNDSILYAERAYRDKLYPLPGVKEEVNNISKVIPGDLYVDDFATERNFKDHASDYDVLHLAMHTIIDDENPMYSKLVFTQVEDTTQDGLLNTHEIYNMNFNARMVVLSACNTGDGKLMKGEGVMSLARGFFYAGCPSIIMTLWTVEDQTGSNLMTNFYNFLSQGLKKDEALRQAKLEYLKTADPLKSHPYFWSGYVTMGDVEPLYDFNLKSNIAYMAFGSLGLIFLLIAFRRFRAKKMTA